MELTAIEIGQRIHKLRDQDVILDYDLANFYTIETKYLKRAVRRNLDRFPNDFMFELTRDELTLLRYQIGTSKYFDVLSNTRYLPLAFTELGVSMLSGLLTSPKAIEINIAIMRAFVQLRHALKNPIAKNEVEIDSRLRVVEEKTDVISELERKINLLLMRSEQQISSMIDVGKIKKVVTLGKGSDSRVMGKRSDSRIDDIQRLVAEYYGLHSKDLESRSRKKFAVLPRQIAMYLIRKHIGLSLREIGNLFGKKDHTTVLHAQRTIGNAAKQNRKFIEALEDIERQLLG